MPSCTLAALLMLAGPSGTPLAPTDLVVPAEPMPPPVMLIPPLAFVHPNPLDVWQLLAPDRRGHFNRPRVVRAPDGTAYFLSDGRPYPYGPIFPRDETIWVTGTSYRSR